jgi:hypothetical protein
MSPTIGIGISVQGNKHVKYLFALLQSLNIVQSVSPDFKIQILYKDVSKDVIRKILKKMPWVSIREYRGYQSKLFIPGKLNFWNELVKTHRYDEIVLLDADTVVIRNFGEFFNKDFDVGYTYKTEESENLNWPLNTGVILVKRNERSLSFFDKWTEYTNSIVSEGRKIGLCSKNWGAVDQASLGMMLNTRDKNKYSQIIKVGDVKCQGFPCKILNETRCVSLTDAYIVHYKGWMQKVIDTGKYNQYRPEEKCKCQYNLWLDMIKQWEEL